MTMKKYYVALAVSLSVAGAAAAVSLKRGGAPIIPDANLHCGFQQNKNCITDFGRIMQYDPTDIHFYLVKIQDNHIEMERGFAKAAECYQATFTEEPADGPWRTCVALDEPSEGFLALYISSLIGRHAGAAAEGR